MLILVDTLLTINVDVKFFTSYQQYSVCVQLQLTNCEMPRIFLVQYIDAVKEFPAFKEALNYVTSFERSGE